MTASDGPAASNKKTSRPQGREVIAVPPCCADTSRCRPWGLDDRGAGASSPRRVPGPVTEPTRRSLLRWAQARQFGARLRGAYPARGAAPYSQHLRLSVASPDPRTLLVLAVARSCCVGTPAARHSLTNRTALSGERERAEGRGDKHATLPSPLISRNVPPEFAPCPRRCGWVARRLRAVVPQPLLMRANARIQLLHK